MLSFHQDTTLTINIVFDRNKQIAEYSDYIVAFMNKEKYTSGTLSTIEEAQNRKKKVIIIH